MTSLALMAGMFIRGLGDEVQRVQGRQVWVQICWELLAADNTVQWLLQLFIDGIRPQLWDMVNELTYRAFRLDAGTFLIGSLRERMAFRWADMMRGQQGIWVPGDCEGQIDLLYQMWTDLVREDRVRVMQAWEAPADVPVEEEAQGETSDAGTQDHFFG